MLARRKDSWVQFRFGSREVEGIKVVERLIPYDEFVNRDKIRLEL